MEPPVPQGPGVVPLFAVPPTERDPKRVWIGLGIAVTMLVVCGIGGVVGLGVVYTSTARQTRHEAAKVVGQYLEQLKRGRYTNAYDLRCSKLRSAETYTEFLERSSREPVTGYTVGQAKLNSADLQVPAIVDYATRTGVARTYTVTTKGTRFYVCDER